MYIMNNLINKSKIISSLFWKLMERGGTQGIQSRKCMGNGDRSPFPPLNVK